MSEILHYKPNAPVVELSKDTIDRIKSYPSQDDPDYWSKVPNLFSEEFDTEEKISQFKANWITYKVPLCLQSFGDLETSYLRDAFILICNNIEESKQQEWFDMFIEPMIGHSSESYKACVKDVKANFNNKEVTLKNVGPSTVVKVHNIIKFEKETGKSFSDYDAIVEVGGGAGELIRLIRVRGFTGEYHDVDFEPICKLNHFNNSYDERNYYYRSIKDIPPLEGKKVLFISTWSFSELSFEDRDIIINRVKNFDWLVTLQANVFGRDNLNYFVNDIREYTGRSARYYNIPWHLFQEGNFYMFMVNK